MKHGNVRKGFWVIAFLLLGGCCSFNTAFGQVVIGGSFSSTYDVAVGASGNTYVTSMDGNSVVIIRPDETVTIFGQNGFGPGEFANGGPAGIAVDAAENVYVTDRGGNRVQVFDSEGNYKLSKMGFNFPVGIAIDDANGRIGVVEEGGHVLKVFDSDLELLFTVGSLGTATGQFNTPTGIDFDNAGNIFIADYVNNRVQVFDKNGVFVKAFGSQGSADNQFSNPSKIAIHNNEVYVSDDSNDIRVFDLSGTFLRRHTFTQSGVIGSHSAVAFSSDGDILLTSGTSSGVFIFHPDGTFIKSYGAESSADGGLNYPGGVARLSSGDIVVGEVANRRVQIFSPSGAFKSKFGSFGSGPGQFGGSVIDVDVDQNDNIHVVDPGNKRIQKFSSAGVYIRSTSTGTLMPGKMALDASGDVWVVFSGNAPLVKKYDGNTGDELLSFGVLGDGPGQFRGGMRDIAIDQSNGNVYVVDASNCCNGRVQVFNSAGVFQSVMSSIPTTVSQIAIAGSSLYVTGFVDYLIKAYDISTGALQLSASGKGLAFSKNNGLNDMEFDATSQMIYLCDYNNNRVQVMSYAPEIHVRQASNDLPQNVTLDLGTVILGESSEAKVTIFSQGLTNINLSGNPLVQISGTHASEFVIDQTNLAPSFAASSSFKVTFTPGATGLRTATILIPNSDPNEGDYTFVIVGSGKLTQAITFEPLNAKTYTDPSFALVASAESNLPVIFQSSNTSVATVSGNTVTITGAGTTTIKATQGGSDVYASASKTRELTVTSSQLAVKADNKNRSYASANPSLTLTYAGFKAGEGPAVLDVAPVAGTQATMTSDVGDYDIVPSAGADNNYTFTYVKGTLTINKADQVITFPAVPSKTLGSAAFNLSASASSSLPVVYATSSDKVSLSGAQVTLAKAGRVSIKATQTGNKNYNAATAEVSFCIDPSKPLITASFTNPEAPVLTSSNNAGNQWYLNNTQLNGATNATLTASQAGTYKVQTKADDCLSEFSSDYVLVVTGVEHNNVEPVSVYPNPTTDFVRISGVSSKAAHAVSAITGVGQSLPYTFEDGSLVIDVRALATGIYVVRFSGTQGARQVSFVKK